MEGIPIMGKKFDFQPLIAFTYRRLDRLNFMDFYFKIKIQQNKITRVEGISIMGKKTFIFCAIYDDFSNLVIRQT